MPPYAWLESERRAHITDLGRVQLHAGNTDGMRGVVLRALASRRSMQVEALARVQDRRLGSRGVPGSGRRSGSRPASRRGVHALVTALAKEGLVTITQPLRGRASAFRTVRVAALTAQGLDLATSARDHSPHPPHVPHSPGSSQLGARQREVIESAARLSRRPGNGDARLAWRVARDIGTPGSPWAGDNPAEKSRA